MARIDDGHKTLITFAETANVKFYEKSVTPPSMSAGGANDTTTMHNDRWRTNAPKKLITMGDMSVTAAYDPAVLTQIKDMLGKNQEITVTHPDGSTWKFWGWVDEFTPGANSEGSQPTAEVKIICSNQDDLGVETEPTYTAAPVTP